MTFHHTKLYAYELTRRRGSEETDKFAGALVDGCISLSWGRKSAMAERIECEWSVTIAPEGSQRGHPTCAMRIPANAPPDSGLMRHPNMVGCATPQPGHELRSF